MSESLAEPSAFWEELGREHSDMLQRDGFELVKRRQALRHFTWRWRWNGMTRSEQMRYLLKHLPPTTPARMLATPARLSGSAWHDVSWSRRERWLYVFAVRLLWEYARRHGSPAVLALHEPELGGPLPVHAAALPRARLS